MIYLLIVLATIAYLLYVKLKNRSLPPGPWNLPIVGALPFLDARQPHVTLTDWAKKYGPIYGLNLGSVYTVVLTDPKTIRTVFSKDVTTGRAPLYLTHGIMNGYGIICAEGDLWKDQRRFVHNSLRQFGASKVGGDREKLEEMIMENVLDFVNYIKHLGNDVSIDPLDSLRHNLGSVINLLVFGKSWSRDDEIWKWLQHLQEEGTKLIGVAGPLNFLPFLIKIPMFKRTMDFLIKGKLKTHKFYQQLIDEQVEIMKTDDTMKKSNLIQTFLEERSRRKNTDTVKKFYTDQQFYHLLADIFGAGLDTTLTTLRWHLLYMATNEDIQNDIRNQINENVPNRLLKFNDISNLPLVEASITETQRIRSVVPVGIPHGSLYEFEIEGYKIPKKTMIVPLQWAIHMDETVFPDPERYNPCRFINDDGKFCKPESFIPFQTGKRMCVGDELARMLLFLFSATILQNFHLSIDDLDSVNLTGDCGITLTPKPQNIVFKKLF